MPFKNTIKIHYIIIALAGVLLVTVGYRYYMRHAYENKILKQMITRLEADSRIAEVLVTEVKYNPVTQQNMTTIKFLEYDAQNQPLTPKYFTFAGNIIQFQSLVIRFEDIHIKEARALKDKSAYIFWKVFLLDGAKTQEYEINKFNQVPEGYKIKQPSGGYEKDLWQQFWKIALDAQEANKRGIKNAQIEAPGTKFIPGMLYTLKIEHDGGIRIDGSRIPEILKGEKL